MYKDKPVAQNKWVMPTFDKLFSKVIPATIIELGTHYGGLIQLLYARCIKFECYFVTYDIKQRMPDMFTNSGIDYRLKDVFDNEEEIAELIQLDDVTILLCDNGDKIKEFNTFCPYLKPGDFILAHDYAKNRNYFRKHMHGKLWDYCEITLKDIRASIKEYNLKPIMGKEWQKAAWCCFKKED